MREWIVPIIAPEIGAIEPISKPDIRDNNRSTAFIYEKINRGYYRDKGQYEIADIFKDESTPFLLKKGIEYFGVSVNVFRFLNKDLQEAKQYLDLNWKNTVNENFKTGGSGDTYLKEIEEFPLWVNQYQNKLAVIQPELKLGEKAPIFKSHIKTNPRWDDNATLAQRLVEAFLREWFRQINGTKEIPSNLEEMFKRIGASERLSPEEKAQKNPPIKGNARADLLGDPNLYGWCQPALQSAIILGLMRYKFMMDRRSQFEKEKNLQPLILKSKNFSQMPIGRSKEESIQIAFGFKEELERQREFFLKNWVNNSTKSSTKRVIDGVQAYIAPLQPGDYISSIKLQGSPLSGHVVGVVKEIINKDLKGLNLQEIANLEPGSLLSTIYCISGNAGLRGGGSVRIEKIEREMPPKNQEDLFKKMDKIGNDYTKARYENANAKTTKQFEDSGQKMIKLREEAAKDNIPYHHIDDPKVHELLRSKNGEILTGKFHPYLGNRGWVRIIVNVADFLNANKITKQVSNLDDYLVQTGEKSSIMEKNGLLELKGTINTLWPGAIEYWEGKGASFDYE